MNMNTTHTPGPWYLNIDTVHIRKGVSIQPVTHHMDVQGMADARLIAAAPALLENLRQLCELLESIGHDCTPARESIAKATGVK